MAPPDLIDSWDPADDETEPEPHRPAQWDWHGYPTWGRRAVAAFPVVAVVLAVGLFAVTTVSAQGAIAQVQSVTGTGGAILLSHAPQGSAGRPGSGAGQPPDYHDVNFQIPGSAVLPIEGSSSLALPNYPGWEANGSAGPSNGLATVNGGLLHVAVRVPTPDYRGWFLTATSPTPASCAFQFSAASPPPVTSTDSQAVGELVMAVQTSSTVTSGDIDYVVVAETVTAEGRRNLVVGYALGHLSHAVAHVLKEVPWSEGPLRVAIETNGNTSLTVWVNGAPFYAAHRPADGHQAPVRALPRSAGPSDPLYGRLRRLLERVPERPRHRRPSRWQPGPAGGDHRRRPRWLGIVPHGQVGAAGDRDAHALTAGHGRSGPVLPPPLLARRPVLV